MAGYTTTNNGDYESYAGVVNSGASITEEIDLTRAWTFVYLRTPPKMPGDIWIRCQQDISSTVYRRIAAPNLWGTTHFDFTIKSSCNNRLIPIPAGGLRYLKIECDDAPANSTTTFNFLCGGT